MAILAQLGKVSVEVLDAHTDSTGRKFARVHAIEGEPFQTWTIGGWATTSTTTVRAELLGEVHQDQPRPVHVQAQRVTLLDLAKAAAREQWRTGESSWIWGSPKAGGAYLKNVNGFVRLYTTQTGAPGLNVYMLGRDGWKPVKNLDQNYRDWMLQLKGGAE